MHFVLACLQANAEGSQLKDMILERGVVQKCLDYMQGHVPAHAAR